LKIKSFGCSFIFGSELSDIRTRQDLQPSALTWPALIAQQRGWQYECYAYPGRGNLYIADRVLEQVSQARKGDVFVINWTWVDRFDYFAAQDDSWSSILPRDQGKVQDVYHRHLHSQKRDKLVSLMYIMTAIQALRQRKLPFVMTYMDHILAETRWHTDAAIQALQQQVLPCLRDFQGENFLEWSRRHQFAVSDLWHPLEQAHAAAATLMMPSIDATLRRA
jgi:hypothetical protein